MKYYLLTSSIFFFLVAFGQYENSSFYFANYKLDSAESFEGFKDADLGYYDLEDAQYKQMILTKDSISVRFGSEVIISKKEALAKGYTFKDDKMYGIAPLNGVRYTEFNDTILALYYQYDRYLGASGTDFVQPMEKGYLIFIKEKNGFFSVEYLVIKGKKMLIHSLDHVTVMDKLLKISDVTSSEKNGVVTYFANPSFEELASLIKSKCFDDTREYVLNSDL